ncbi:hypothetical protein BGZ73_002581 [Actinomortierella ambigua]|nr:hypothetical protein BGZ73_002581 [Actinomortierella ambigua]
MTPTSRLAETAVSVREVSKKIGRARVKWETPKTVMIVTKPGDETLLKITRQIALWMIVNRGLRVYVDEKLKDQPKFRYPKFLRDASTETTDYTQHLSFWTADLCAQEAHLFDFAITLGGDGTVLFTSWLFQRIVPPILPFSAGSLGFLTPFPTTDYQRIIGNSLDQGVRVSLRMRFSCTIYRCLEHRAAEKEKKSKNPKARKGKSPSSSSRRNAGKGRRGDRRSKKPTHGHPDSSDSSDEDNSNDDSDGHDGEFRKRSLPTVLTTPTETFEILNDLVLDRGPSANLSLLELFGDEEHLTTVQADGIVISTPTGSTAYSLAAGGPLTHPDIPAILISPICPHTLSFRPMLLPDSMELRICVPFDSRSTAWASFDGRGRVELKQGDHIKVTASAYPFPTICSSTQSSDWFHSLSRCLRWNERQRQKGFRVVEHSRPRRTRQQSTTMTPTTATAATTMSAPAPQASRNGTHGGELSGSNAEAFQSADNSSQNDSHQSSSKTPSQRKRQINLERQQQQQQQATGVPMPLSTASSPGNHPVQTNGSNNTGKVRLGRASQPSPVSSHSGRKGRFDLQDEYDPSFQHTETMLTCWGTDYHDSDYYDDDDDDDDFSRNVSGVDEERAEEGDAEWEEGFATSDESDVEAAPPLVRNRLTATSSPEIVAAVTASLPVASCPPPPPPVAESKDGSAMTRRSPVLTAIETVVRSSVVSTQTQSSSIPSARPSPPQRAGSTAASVGSCVAATSADNGVTPSGTPPKDLMDHLRIPKSTSPVSDGCISFDDDSRVAEPPSVVPGPRPLPALSNAARDIHESSNQIQL